MINYKLILYIYSAVFLLLLINIGRDRFAPQNKSLKSCDWSLFSAIIVLFFFLSGEVVKSLWYVKLIPILKEYPYNFSNLEVFSFFYFLFILILIYVFLRYIYSVSIIEVFDLKLSQNIFILKLCAGLAAINILSLYLFDFNLFLNPEQSELEYIQAMDPQHAVLFAFVTIVLAPVAEEFMFRGLLYGPLYRKVGRILAIILSSLIWTQGHFYSLLPSVGVFITGLILGWLYDRKGSLIHPIVLHMFKNSWLLYYYSRA